MGTTLKFKPLNVVISNKDQISTGSLFFQKCNITDMNNVALTFAIINLLEVSR